MKRRTELHIHSNMSVMDGLTDIKMLLEKADRENMYAVAITDHGVCHAVSYTHLTLPTKLEV